MDPFGLFTCVPLDRPSQPVVSTNFTLAYDQATGQMTFTEVLAPSSTYTITTYILKFAGTTKTVEIPVASLPYSFEFSPLQFPAIWQYQTASWNASVTVTARSSSGDGVPSAAASVAIAQSSAQGGYAYYVPSWTYAEVTDAAALGIVGRQSASVPSYTVPTGYDLRWYSGLLEYTSVNFGSIHTVAGTLAITPGAAALLSTAGLAVGNVAKGILLYYNANLGTWFPASDPKSFTVVGLAVVGAPSFSVDPTVSGTMTIGQTLTASFTQSGSTTTTYQWFRAGAAISGATNSTYVLVALDDTVLITVRVTISNSAGSVVRTSPGRQATYAAPTVANAISNVSVNQEPSAYMTQSLASVFTGTNITITKQAGNAAARVSPDSSSLVHSLNGAVTATTITIRATNSGGFVDTTYTLTITAHAAAITDWPADITTATFSEVTDPAVASAQGFAGEDGHIKYVLGAATVAPTGYTLRHDLLSGEIGTPTTSLPASTQNTTVYSSGRFAVGDVARPKLYWRHTATGQLKIAYNPTATTITGLGNGSVTNWPDIANVGTGTNQAQTYPGANFSLSSSGPTNAAYMGSPLFACAYGSFAGQPECDTYVVNKIKEGRDKYGGPSCQCGFVAQHEMGYIAAVAIAKQVPRLWAQFDSAYKASLDLFMKAAMLMHAGGCLEAGITTFSKNLLGGVNPSSAGGGANIRTPHAAIVMICCWYFGSTALAKSMLDAADFTQLMTDLGNSPWSNAYKSLNNPRVPGAPTLAQLQAHCRNGTTGWTRWGWPVTQPDKIWQAEILGQTSPVAITGGMTKQACLSYHQVNGGNGLTAAQVNDSAEGWAIGRGRVVNQTGMAADSRWPPIAGKYGCPWELDAFDNGGIRASASYGEWSLRVQLIYTIMGFISGLVDRKSAAALAAKDAVTTGATFQNLITQYGYLSVAHISLARETAAGSEKAYKSNSEDWDSARTATWGLLFNHEYANVIRDIYALP